jgi:hypothetical protein
VFVGFARKGAVVFVSRAEFPERTGLAAAGAGAPDGSQVVIKPVD